MRTTTSSSIGALSAVPLLLSLLVLAAVIYAGTVAVTAAERRVAERRQAELDAARKAYDAGRERLAEIDEAERRLRARVAELAALDQRVRDARLSRTDLEEQLRKLRDEIATVEASTGGVRRELDAKERIPATRLVPTGSRRPAVFLECDGDGVWMMPERRRLATSPTADERDALLARVKTTGYAVFLVRPTGVESFLAYRDILEEYNRTAARPFDFGFEPVNADWKISYPAGAEGEV
jgi:hypothetical protein